MKQHSPGANGFTSFEDLPFDLDVVDFLYTIYMANSKVNLIDVGSMIIKINCLAMVALRQCFNWASSPSLFRGALDGVVP